MIGWRGGWPGFYGGGDVCVVWMTCLGWQKRHGNTGKLKVDRSADLTWNVAILGWSIVLSYYLCSSRINFDMVSSSTDNHQPDVLSFHDFRSHSEKHGCEWISILHQSCQSLKFFLQTLLENAWKLERELSPADRFLQKFQSLQPLGSKRICQSPTVGFHPKPS